MNKRIFAHCLLLCVGAVSVCIGQAKPATNPMPAAVRPYLTPQLGHTLAVTSGAFSPNGQLVLTGSQDNTVCLWDAPTGKEIRRFVGHSDQVRSVAFSSDGQFVLSGSCDNTARLWNTGTGKEIRQFVGHSKQVRSVAFSPDGQLVLTGSEDRTARLWDLATGKEIRRFTSANLVMGAAFSPDGRFVLTGSGDKTASLWDVATGKEIRQFAGHSDALWSVAFSPDGRFVLTGSWDKTARLWDATTGKQVQQYKGHTDAVLSVAFSPDGRFVLTGSDDGTARLWDAATGKEIQRLIGRLNDMESVRFSPDGRFVLTASWDTTAKLWDAATGKQVRRFTGHSASVVSTAFSPDGRFALIGSGDSVAHLWDMTVSKEIRQFVGHSKQVQSVAFSPDGRFVLTGSVDKTARLWEMSTGKEIRQFTSANFIESVAFSPDGRFVLTGNGDKTASLWDAATGKEAQRFIGHSDALWSVAFSPDGRFVLTGSWDKTARLWDATTSKEIRQFVGHTGWVQSVAFSPDGRFVLTGSWDKTARLWDATTGKEIRQFVGHLAPIMSVAFSPNGRFVLTGSGDGTARLWDVRTGKEIHQLGGHSNGVRGVIFSPDGRFVLTGSTDSTTRLWETATGKELCRLMSFDDGNWAVADNAGRYDASDPDRLQGLYWVAGNEPIDLRQLKARYYAPGLLAKIMCYNKEPLPNVEAFTSVKLYPTVTLKAPANGGSVLRIGLTNRGGGIGKVQVWINGKEFAADARGPKPNVNAPSALLPLDLANAPGLKPGQPNEIRVTARNAEGYLESRGVVLSWTPPGKARPTVTPELYAIVAGIGDYGSPHLHLNLPPRDAAQMANAITLGAKRLFGADKVHLTLLSSDSTMPNALPPTKENFRKAFAALKKQAKPEDILVVFLAGHGVAWKDGYYYLTSEARGFDLSDPDVRQTCTVSDDELAAWTTAIPALKQVMVLDTCAAGTAAHKLAEKRDISGDQIRAIDRLKDRTGFYVLMGCASDAVSYESNQYGQGLLTYALLSGMQGERLRDGQFVDVSPLFEYAADRVPQLAEGLGGIQKPQIMTPASHNAARTTQSASFPIGQMTTEEKRAIVLPQPRPRVLRPNLLNRERVKDDLELSAALRKCLREVSEKAGRGEHLPIYLDIEPEDLPGAVVPSGLYTVSGETVTVDLLLSLNGKDTKLTVVGSKNDIPGLAAKLAATIADALK